MKQYENYKQVIKYVLVLAAVLICGVVYLAGWKQDTAQTKQEYQAERTVAAAGEIQHTSSADERGTADSDGRTEVGETETEENLLFIFVCGAVKVPGVYQCRAGARAYELIDMAGGFGAEADENGLNLVEVVSDGQKLYVPERGETAAENGGTSVSGQTICVNINLAAKEQLMTLPGIGASRAEDIIAYRTRNGKFSSTEEIMKVPGIKSASYEKLKAYICV